MPQTDHYADTLKHVAATLLCAPVATLEELGGGRNSRVYRVALGTSGAYALKAYFRHASDHRARMETEFASLTFLWDNGVRNIPKPVAADPKHNCAIYQWIEGSRIGPQDVTGESVDAAVSFLLCLAELRDRPGSIRLAPASEACFSGQALLENLALRLRPLAAVSHHPDLRTFLDKELIPAFESLSAWSQHKLGSVFRHELRRSARTLSPSDFGFHNALRTAAGDTVFLDMEYFGWDDPAKTISDFLLHPGMALSPALKRRFAGSVARGLSADAGLAERVEAFYPLFGLKWCLILLNEFLPDQLLRRRFAGMNEQERNERQAQQLRKAQSMLQRILTEYEHFSYLH